MNLRPDSWLIARFVIAVISVATAPMWCPLFVSEGPFACEQTLDSVSACEGFQLLARIVWVIYLISCAIESFWASMSWLTGLIDRYYIQRL